MKDINVDTGNSSPQHFGALGSSVYFQAETGAGKKIWKTDGDDTNTVTEVGFNGATINPKYLTAMNNILYFAGETPSDGDELRFYNPLKPNGGGDGALVKDIWTAGYTSPSELTVVGQGLFFSARDGTNGVELWVYYPSESISDTDPKNPKLVKNIHATGDGLTKDESYLTAFKGKLYFVGNDNDLGKELWVSDGTEDGTEMVKDIATGPTSSNPQYLTVVNGKLYFAATDGSSDIELWESDGTAAGTKMVLNPDTAVVPKHLTGSTSSILYFSGNDGNKGRELWLYDTAKAVSTSAGTENPRLAFDLKSGEGSGIDNTKTSILAVGDKAFTRRLRVLLQEGSSTFIVPIPTRPNWSKTFKTVRQTEPPCIFLNMGALSISAPTMAPRAVSSG